MVEAVTVTLNPAIDQTVVIANFTVGQVNRVEQVTSQPGGKGVNVAAALADYGHTVGVTGFLGRENDGAFAALFAQKGITDGFVRIDGLTRTGVKVSDPAQQQTTDINYPGQAPTPANLDTLSHRLGQFHTPWVVVSGSIPPGVPPTIYRDLVAMLIARGRQIVLDTSGDALRAALEAAPHIIKPNIHELEALVGASLMGQDAVVEAAHTLLSRGVQMVVVSMGKEGACFVTAGRVVVARPPDVTVQSTVGAGDAMVAGIVAGQLRGLPLTECARLATAFSLDRITHMGVGLSSLAHVNALMEQVTVDRGA
ncbi:MAG: 1-phosphofructokinase [Chloroflexaceae bacterium]|nr:1-phosphofructokinase [Chloroflexaceae bacterium]